MPEYIEREALMTEINRIGGHNLCEWSTIGVKALVERQPAADVAEVVRCEDCIALRASADGAYCARFSSTREKQYVRIDDFCSFGERKNK